MKKFCVVFSIITFLPFLGYSQDDAPEVNQSISGYYKYLYDNSETYNAYKVFRISSIKGDRFKI